MFLSEITPAVIAKHNQESHDLLYRNNPEPDDLHCCICVDDQLEDKSTVKLLPGLTGKVDNYNQRFNGGRSAVWYPYHMAVRVVGEEVSA